MSRYLQEQLEEAHDRIAALEFRDRNQQVDGPVHERDHEKGVRLRLGGTDEEPFLSPWIQPGDNAGTDRYLPEVGEQLRMHAHGGDWRQATLAPLTHSDDKKNPAKHADDYVFFNKGKMRLAADTKKKAIIFQNDKSKTTWKDGEIEHEVDGVTFKQTKDGFERKVDGVTEKLTKDGADQTGGFQHHDSHDVGATHHHESGAVGSDTGNTNPVG